MQNREVFEQLAQAILASERSASSLFKELNLLSDMLVRIGQYPNCSDGDLAKGETRTAQGLALSPQAAAMCSRDFVRTVQFMRGVFQAVSKQILETPTRTVNLLYVGCGPFALLVLPLMLRLNPQQVQINLIDIHRDSLDSAKRIIDYLELQAFIAEAELVDAMTYSVDRERTPDIVLLEIMQASLEKEPQVALSRHLMKQVPNALLIPENIEVSLCLLDPSTEFSLHDLGHELNHDFSDDKKTVSRQRIHLASLIQVNRQTIQAWENIVDSNLPAVFVTMPIQVPCGYSAMLMTSVKVYGEYELHTYDSGLTYPRHLNTLFRGGDVLCFSYAFGEHPGLLVDVQNESSVIRK
ncbi:hypothetical protein [Undibacterium macrobrachii]|uniref:Phytanoyl-CoA dioxygenase n=1 Tax=Undibacterium macrobrachii TaxID=1119058 RepID=A0ABQ2XFK5_9BURK|nr:hypothetical protein [Undibacterium macrobrachii]GGX14215.1 hypothetical protein GCM10011282_20440 [Undibacterium macrobrachii]